MHETGTPRATRRRSTLFAVLVAVLGATSAFAVAAPARETTRAQAAQDYVLPIDRDQDGVTDTADRCPLEAGDLRNGCPSELNAEVRGRWQANRIYTKLVSLTVEAPIGSRIVLSCGGWIKICGTTQHIISKTTHRLTSLTKFFTKPRIYPSGLSILVKVTRAEQIGLYKRYKTRRGRKAPGTTERCLSTVGRIQPCA